LTGESEASRVPRLVALFRGINVGKAKRIAMGDLRALLANLGYSEVQTLLNSGNAIFDGSDEPAETHARRIRTSVATELGVDALVVVKSAKDMAAAVAGNTLAAVATDASRLLVAFADGPKSLAALKPMSQRAWAPEELHVGKHAAYLWCANGILESRLAVDLLKGLAASGTTRNWATVLKIHALLSPGGA
jgi:uncharacterized protein (DUF1697 family)